jgi:hypothetical protein
MRPDIVVYIYYPGIKIDAGYYEDEDPEWFGDTFFSCHESIRVFDWGDSYK